MLAVLLSSIIFYSLAGILYTELLIFNKLRKTLSNCTPYMYFYLLSKDDTGQTLEVYVDKLVKTNIQIILTLAIINIGSIKYNCYISILASILCLIMIRIYNRGIFSDFYDKIIVRVSLLTQKN